MRHRTEIVGLLYKILAKTYFDSRIYRLSAENCKRLLFKNFFRKLSHQKLSFFKRNKYEIQVLEKEISSMGGQLKQSIEEWKEEATSPILPVFRTEKNGLIKDCYRREKENLELYNNLLSRISVGQIREALLFQKHSVQLILNEIETMGLRVFDEKSEGEKNYQ